MPSSRVFTRDSTCRSRSSILLCSRSLRLLVWLEELRRLYCCGGTRAGENHTVTRGAGTVPGGPLRGTLGATAGAAWRGAPASGRPRRRAGFGNRRQGISSLPRRGGGGQGRGFGGGRQRSAQPGGGTAAHADLEVLQAGFERLQSLPELAERLRGRRPGQVAHSVLARAGLLAATARPGFAGTRVQRTLALAAAQLGGQLADGLLLAEDGLLLLQHGLAELQHIAPELLRAASGHGRGAHVGVHGHRGADEARRPEILGPAAQEAEGEQRTGAHGAAGQHGCGHLALRTRQARLGSARLRWGSAGDGTRLRLSLRGRPALWAPRSSAARCSPPRCPAPTAACAAEPAPFMLPREGPRRGGRQRGRNPALIVCGPGPRRGGGRTGALLGLPQPAPSRPSLAAAAPSLRLRRPALAWARASAASPKAWKSPGRRGKSGRGPGLGDGPPAWRPPNLRRGSGQMKGHSEARR